MHIVYLYYLTYFSVFQRFLMFCIILGLCIFYSFNATTSSLAVKHLGLQMSEKVLEK